jgi:hypothetical protein
VVHLAMVDYWEWGTIASPFDSPLLWPHPDGVVASQKPIGEIAVPSEILSECLTRKWGGL